MTPAGSWPGVTRSSGVGSVPSMRWTSDRQMPHACTRTRTSPGPGSGSGTSTTSSRRLAESKTAARTRVTYPGPLRVREDPQAEADDQEEVRRSAATRRDPRADARPVAGWAGDLEGPLERLDAVGDAAQARADGRVGAADAVVVELDEEVLGRLAHADGDQR